MQWNTIDWKINYHRLGQKKLDRILQTHNQSLMVVQKIFKRLQAPTPQPDKQKIKYM